MTTSPSSRANAGREVAALRRELSRLKRENQAQRHRIDVLDAQSSALRESEARYRELWRGAFEGIVLHERGKVLDCNPAYAKLFGYTLKEMIGSSVYRHLDPKVHTQVKTRIDRNSRYRAHITGRRKNGSLFHMEYFARPILLDGRVVRVVTVRDISHLVKHQEQLAASEERFRNLVEGSIQGILVHRGGKPLFANQALAEIVGYPSPSAIARMASFRPLVKPDSWKVMQRYYRQRTAGKPAPLRYEFEGQHRDGHTIWLENSARPVMWEGRPAVQCTWIDITERKRREEELSTQQRLLQTVMDTIPHSVFVKDEKERYRLVNRAMAQRWKKPPEAFIGFTSAELGVFPPERVHDLHTWDRKVLTTGQPVERTDVPMHSRAGATLYHVVRYPVRDARGKVAGLVAVSQDVTESRRAELALRDSEQRFRTLVEGSIQGIAVFRGHQAVFSNSAFARIGGYRNPEEVLALASFAQMTHPEDLAKLEGFLARVILGQETDPSIEFRGVRKDGRVIWVNAIASPVRWHDLPCMLIAMLDVTERKHAAEHLQQSEERFRNLIEGSIQGTVIHRDYHPLFVNQAFADIYGYASTQEVMALPSLQVLNAPEQRGDMRRVHLNRLRGAEAPARYEIEGIRKDGSRIALECLARVVNWEGQPAVQYTLIDATERKHGEAAVRASQRLLQTVLDSIPLCIFTKDRKGRIVFANRAQSEFDGVPPERLAGVATQQYPNRTPEQIAENLEWDRRVIHQGDSLDIPAYVRQDHVGRSRWLRGMRRPIRDERGRVVGQLGVNEDISDRREAELALRQSEERYRNLVEGSIQGILIQRDFTTLFVNRQFSLMHGYDSPDSLVGVGDSLKLLAEEDRPMVRHYNDEYRKGKMAPSRMEVRGLRRDGTTFWRENVMRQVIWDDGLPAIQVTTQDITDRKTAEEQREKLLTDLRQANADLESSQRLLQTVFDTIPLRLMMKDTSSRYLLVNRAMANNYGAPVEAFIGNEPADLPFLSEEERAGFYQEDRQVMQTGAPLVIPELRVRTRGGEEEVRRLIKMPVFDDRGAVIAVIGVIENITDRKAAERQREELLSSVRRANDQLATSQRLLRTIFDTIPHRLAVSDDDSRYMMVNQAMASRYGRPEDAFVGRTPRELPFLPSADQGRFVRANLAVLETGAPFELPEVRSDLPGGREEIVRLLNVPVRDANGRIAATVSVTEDITERRRADAIREELVADLRRANDDLRDFAYIVSHDLKAPLRGISSLSEWLAEDFADKLGEEGRENLTLLRARTRRMSALLEGILTYSRIGRLPTATIPVDTAAVVQDVIDTLGPPANVRVEVDGPLPTVNYDAAQLAQVFQNLIGNAIQHLGKPAGTVRVAGQQEDGFWRFSVADDGIGIESRHFDRIFKIFQRIKGNQDSGGTGLGLSVVKKIVETQGGSVRVESIPGSGSVFSFTVRDVQG